MRFVSFSGVDGSGKSTQLKLVQEKLEGAGKKVAYFHAVEFSSANRLARFFKKEKSFEPGKEKAITNASWFSVMLREKFLFLDMLRFYFLLKKLRREHYDYLLSDRSFYDSLIHLRYLSHSWCVTFGLFFLEAILPKADTAFYFELTPEIIMTREHPPEQGIDYLRTKMAIFKEKTTPWNMIIINAEREKQDISQDILTLL